MLAHARGNAVEVVERPRSPLSTIRDGHAIR